METEQFIFMSPALSKQAPRKRQAKSASQLQKSFVRGKIYQDLGMNILFQNIAQQRWAKWVLVVVSKCAEKNRGGATQIEVNLVYTVSSRPDMTTQ